jgi:hypothetical protein
MTRFNAILIVLAVTALGTGACALVAWFIARMNRQKND